MQHKWFWILYIRNIQTFLLNIKAENTACGHNQWWHIFPENKLRIMQIIVSRIIRFFLFVNDIHISSASIKIMLDNINTNCCAWYKSRMSLGSIEDFKSELQAYDFSFIFLTFCKNIFWSKNILRKGTEMEERQTLTDVCKLADQEKHLPTDFQK